MQNLGCYFIVTFSKSLRKCFVTLCFCPFLVYTIWILQLQMYQWSNIVKSVKDINTSMLHCLQQHSTLFDLMLYIFLQPSYLEKYPSFYHSALCERLKSFVRSPLFEYIVIFVLLMNLVAVIIETTVWQFFFLLICVLFLFNLESYFILLAVFYFHIC